MKAIHHQVLRDEINVKEIGDIKNASLYPRNWDFERLAIKPLIFRRNTIYLIA